MLDLIVALGLVLVIEGLIYALFPGGAKRMAFEVQSVPEGTLRSFGLTMMIIGVGVVWFMKG